MANKLKGKRALDTRQTFRADPLVNQQFERLVDEHGFCKSSVLRKLQAEWVQAHLALLGEEQ